MGMKVEIVGGVAGGGERTGGVLADICRKDRPCPNYMVPKPCPEKDICVMLSCTELSPCTELFTCPEDVGPTPIPTPKN